MTRLIICVATVLAGCGPAPRSPAYFEAHPEETARILAQCAGAAPAPRECPNAREGQSSIDRNARMQLYRRSFE